MFYRNILLKQVSKLKKFWLNPYIFVWMNILVCFLISNMEFLCFFFNFPMFLLYSFPFIFYALSFITLFSHISIIFWSLFQFLSQFSRIAHQSVIFIEHWDKFFWVKAWKSCQRKDNFLNESSNFTNS